MAQLTSTRPVPLKLSCGSQDGVHLNRWQRMAETDDRPVTTLAMRRNFRAAHRIYWFIRAERKLVDIYSCYTTRKCVSPDLFLSKMLKIRRNGKQVGKEVRHNLEELPMIMG